MTNSDERDTKQQRGKCDTALLKKDIQRKGAKAQSRKAGKSISVLAFNLPQLLEVA